LDGLKQIANLLLEKEVIFKEDLEDILGKRPWKKEEEEVSKVNESEEKEAAKEVEENNNEKSTA
jgi:cell division protease FtsH